AHPYSRRTRLGNHSVSASRLSPRYGIALGSTAMSPTCRMPNTAGSTAICFGCRSPFPAKRHRARRANGTHPDLSCNRESQARHRRTLLGDVDDKRHAELSWRLQWVQFIAARSVYREHRALRRVRATELSVRHASVVWITLAA